MSNILPLRFRPDAVERYWPYIKTLCESWPCPVIINPAPFSPETFSCRFRDALKGIVQYGQGTDEQLQLVEPIYGMIVIRQENGKIIAGPKSAVRGRKASPGHVIDAKVGDVSEVESPSVQILDALFVLLNANIISHITVKNVDESALTSRIQQSTRPLEIVSGSHNSFSIF